MTFAVEVFSSQSYAREAAARIALRLPGEGSVVLTGGNTVEPVYEALAASDAGWGGLEVFFSDERCVPPDDAASNYGLARRALLDPVGARRVHRMKGEDPPEPAAAAYHEEVAALARGFDLVLLGMGTDCHIAAMFPGSRALEERQRLCVAVKRPDGLEGLTLTPPALVRSHTIVFLVSGADKAEATRRAVTGDEDAQRCPVRLLAEHGDVTFLLDEAAAAGLAARGTGSTGPQNNRGPPPGGPQS
jgi:6-phosphogluconolactonase